MPSVKADLKKEAVCVQHISLVAYAFYPPVLAKQKTQTAQTPPKLHADSRIPCDPTTLYSGVQ